MQRLGNLVLCRDVVPRLQLPAWRELGWLTHGWSTRLGGVSQGQQASLNTSYTQDQRDRVDRNRLLWHQELQIAGWPEVYMEQVHGATVAVATAPGVLAATDGVVTDRPGLALHVMVADCLPILLLCRNPRAIGVVHAGWRGTVAAIASQAVSVLRTQFGIKPSEIEACIGPGIGACCYLVDEPVLSKVRALPVEWQLTVEASTIPGQYYLDLPSLNRLLLLQAGLLPENIHLSQICTHDDAAHFFSYRRDQGDTGRMIATIGLIPEQTAGFVEAGREVLQQSHVDGVESIVC